MNSMVAAAPPADVQTKATHLSYAETGFFSKLVLDYLSGNQQLSPFYEHPPTLAGIVNSIDARKQYATNRELLVKVLSEQYANMPLNSRQETAIQSLLNENCFTVTTAHQPNLFTGPLYFLYKILHTIALAEQLQQEMPAYTFVPIYYMGSEDADLDELGHCYINEEKIAWLTNQTGAVGRMIVDEKLVGLIDQIHHKIGISPKGNHLKNLLTQCYTIGKTIQQATLELVNTLFAKYGLLVVVPDNALLKSTFIPIITKELTEQFSYQAVASTTEELGKFYSVQASGRTLNLFYLINDQRLRIELIASPDGVKTNHRYQVKELELDWDLAEILQELQDYPDRFSANVILRGVFQEHILPNIAFIGGGGELAYWLELKQVFKTAGVPYPVLLLRNSFLLMNAKQAKTMKKMFFSVLDFFKSELTLIQQYVRQHSDKKLHLTEEKQQIETAYDQINQAVEAIDPTLAAHANALRLKTIQYLLELEKKMLRAEKRKFATQQQQIIRLKQQLFPSNNLQERITNFAPFYAAEGEAWIDKLYLHSKGLDQTFTIITSS